ncbi:MAG: pyrroloquinoline quinone biosynthesis protein PqqB [Rhodobacteraceae bacterium]|nr:MAG: pyrroloquinoline quinone biosynthesis protein PqqB [Paracoccaceae bacterium]
MQILVLGAGAGGGLPQWNCGCKNCLDARNGTIPPMTQSSVAVSVDGSDWCLLNASPDIRTQMQANAPLHPRSVRGTPIRSVVLTNADIDHIAGLLTLREKTAFTVFATPETHDVLAANSVFGVLDSDLVQRSVIQLDQPFTPTPGLSITPFAVPGKVALFLEGTDLDLKAMGEQTIGLRISDGAKVLYYVPGCAEVPDWLVAQMKDADMLLFDGTVWENDDMQQTGTGVKTGARMGHMAMSGPDGSIARLSPLDTCDKVFIHINNTNPLLQPHGPERAEATAAGWRLAQDGMIYQL